MARVEGILSQMDRRIESFERSVGQRFGAVEGRFDSLERRIDSLERRIDALDKKFYWLIGVVLATWITTILTILFKG